jgi:hypothetical protein
MITATTNETACNRWTEVEPGCEVTPRQPGELTSVPTPQGLGDGIGRFPVCGPLGNFLAKFDPELRSSDPDALGLRPGHTALCAVADLRASTFARATGLSQAMVSYGSGHWDTLIQPRGAFRSGFGLFALILPNRTNNALTGRPNTKAARLRPANPEQVGNLPNSMAVLEQRG